jgi:hypothetical protein
MLVHAYLVSEQPLRASEPVPQAVIYYRHACKNVLARARSVPELVPCV